MAMNIERFDEPFTYFVIDNYLDEDTARKLESEFIPFDSNKWFTYDNPVENKKALNSWYEFPPTTYQYISYLNSTEHVESLERLTGESKLYPDPGLHGAGWHIQGNGGLLNVHLDYCIHPKLLKKRKYNLIVYLSDWEKGWGGNLELWSHDSLTNQPKEKVVTLECKFNRAVLFDASMNSWHGFSEPINCPHNTFRKSIAMYYLVDSEGGDSDRKRALYSPRKEQQNNREVLDFIKKRAIG